MNGLDALESLLQLANERGHNREGRPDRILQLYQEIVSNLREGDPAALALVGLTHDVKMVLQAFAHSPMKIADSETRWGAVESLVVSSLISTLELAELSAASLNPHAIRRELRSALEDLLNKSLSAHSLDGAVLTEERERRRRYSQVLVTKSYTFAYTLIGGLHPLLLSKQTLAAQHLEPPVGHKELRALLNVGLTLRTPPPLSILRATYWAHEELPKLLYSYVTEELQKLDGLEEYMHTYESDSLRTCLRKLEVDLIMAEGLS